MAKKKAARKSKVIGPSPALVRSFAEAEAALCKKYANRKELALTKDDAALVIYALEICGTECKQSSIDPANSAKERREYRRMWEDCLRLCEQIGGE